MRRSGHDKRTLRLAFSFFAVSALAPYTTQAASIGLYADQNGTGCTLADPPAVAFVPVYVIVKGSTGSSAAQFRVSPVGCPSYQFVAFTPAPGLISLGHPESGVGISFGSCVVGDFQIAFIHYVKLSEPAESCCGIRTEPHPDAVTGEVELLDCADVAHAVDHSLIWFKGDDACVPMPPPSDPFPADGATDVPLNVTLSCTFHDDEVEFSRCVPLFGDGVNVYFGTEPDPPLATPAGQFPLPRSLQPGATYYWRVERLYGPARASSPVWSFTAIGPVPVTTTTWGAIKALYQ